MCGIVGLLDTEEAVARALEALRRLEYRGYDSAGVSTVVGGVIQSRRAVGKLKQLEQLLKVQPLSSSNCIGHTRWATHGKPTEANAHPHATDLVSVVHNGIIERASELRAELEKSGTVFKSDTDTEVVVHLVSNLLRAGLTPYEAVSTTMKRLRGSYALAFLFAGDDDLLIGTRRGSPLLVGHGQGAMYLGSDVIALAPLTEMFSFLEDGDIAVIRRRGVEFYDSKSNPVDRAKVKVDVNRVIAAKEGFRHFMEKEIHEQPDVVGDTLRSCLDMHNLAVALPELKGIDLGAVKRIIILACGTSYYAGLIAKYWIEQYAGISVVVDIASEYRYRGSPAHEGDLVVLISQSGETADTVSCLKQAKEHGQQTLAVVNVPTSTIARESLGMFQTLAGPEIGVASTKAFTCQLAVLACLALHLAKVGGRLPRPQEKRMVRELLEVPRHMEKALQLDKQIESLAPDLAKHRDILYLGRGTSFPLALEGALKLKEISYIHAEGYAAGELKHGPIALIDENTPTVVIAPYDKILFEKTESNMQEVNARSGPVIVFTDSRGKKGIELKTLATLVLPELGFLSAPMVYAVLIQLLAYHVARIRGTDIDQPRNLAKSVTVE